jgi:hypothetical protein
MAGQLYREPDLYRRGSKEPISASDLDQETVKANTEVTVWSKQVNQDQVLFHGHGSHVREVAEAFAYLDLVATGSGAASSAGDPVNGKLVLAITDSDQRRVLRSITFDELDELRDAANENRSERPVEEALAPYGKPGRYLEVRVEADTASDGYEIDPSASSGRLWYTRIQ